MLETFLKVIEKDELVSRDDELLVAVSGGVDSMVLVHLLKAAGRHFTIAHCNFKLRGEASDGDEAFVRSAARKLEVPFFIETFETNNYASQKGISIQMAARELRYDWFEALMSAHDFTKLLTAHHLDDSLETILLNLTKGTGLSGLRGILPGKGHLIRPLIHFTKAQIMEYAMKERFEWREDSSNRSGKYQRNLVRHNVIPVLKQINPGLLSTFRYTQERLQATEAFLEEVLQQRKEEWVKQEGPDTVIDFRKINNPVILEFLIKPYGFTFDQVRRIFELMLRGASGKVFYSAGHKLNIDRDSLIITPKIHGGGIPKEIQIRFKDTLIAGDHFELTLDHKEGNALIPKSRSVASLDLDKLIFPLTLRRWRDGDWFYPLGMKGKKKVSDFMIDNKIPLNLKERVFVLTSDGDIVWVVGHRVDDRFKVTQSTLKVCYIHMHTHDQSF